MSQNTFLMYEQLRSYQLHCHRLESQHVEVPKHSAYSPPAPKLERAKEYHRNKRQIEIESENDKIMHKLIKINQRGHSTSTPNLSLPPIKKNKFQIPLHEQSNNLMAKKIISSKSSINTLEHLRGYRTLEERRRRISKYESAGSVPVNRKKYVAELLLLKKLKNSRVINSEI